MSALVRRDRERGGTVHASADVEERGGTVQRPSPPGKRRGDTLATEPPGRPSVGKSWEVTSRGEPPSSSTIGHGGTIRLTNGDLRHCPGPTTRTVGAQPASRKAASRPRGGPYQHPSRPGHVESPYANGNPLGQGKAPPLRCPDATGTPHQHQQQQHQRTDKVRHSPRPSTVEGHTGHKASTPITPPGRRCISQRQPPPLTLPPPRQATPRVQNGQVQGDPPLKSAGLPLHVRR
ncbi:hypothetical protein WOLCODRAFT_147240 [Wolfiporia cocos MD-104 SS10]|uniref:Uncharacterized protein n=1 Tax=Wolfiporia cocos (strain MD-104) TaxID=742152 RepID=A0A2H3IT32_WOLCO|nr:hypothetical protein WOLCODRAFT_147240 [Wolfiporia cocos MD-104 SS10]